MKAGSIEGDHVRAIGNDETFNREGGLLETCLEWPALQFGAMFVWFAESLA